MIRLALACAALVLVAYALEATVVAQAVATVAARFQVIGL